MPRQTRFNLKTPTGRAKLKPQSAPYWVPLITGKALGYRKTARSSAWMVRVLVGKNYRYETFAGRPDDHLPADGCAVLTHEQAVAYALRVDANRFAGEANEQSATLVRRQAGAGMTIDDAVMTYLEDRRLRPGGKHQKVMPASTFNVQLGSWRTNGQATLGKLPAGATHPKTLRQWHAGIALRAGRRRGKYLPFDPENAEQVRARQETANRNLTIVKAALNHCWRDGLLCRDARDWWRTVEPFRITGRKAPKMMDEPQIHRFLHAAAQHSEALHTLVLGALLCGGRVGELREMRVDDYHSDTQTLRIVQSKTYKTLNQGLSEEGVSFFESLTKGRTSGEPMFANAEGKQWSRGEHTRPIRQAFATAGLAGYSMKSTRATYGKLLLLANRDIELVARALGHSDSRVTREHYAAYLPNEVRAAIARLPVLGRQLSGATAPALPSRKRSELETMQRRERPIPLQKRSGP